MASWPTAKIPKPLPGLRRWLRSLRASAKRGRVIASEYFDAHETEDGTQLLPRLGSGPSGLLGAEPYPFKVYFRDFGTGSPVWRRGVNLESPVQQSEDKFDLIYADGLLDDDDPAKASAGWQPTADNDLIWGELTFDPTDPDNPFTVTDHQIFSTSAGHTYPTGGEAEYADFGDPGASPPTHIWSETKLRYPIAIISQASTAVAPKVKVRYQSNVVRLVEADFTAVLSGGGSPHDITGRFYA